MKIIVDRKYLPSHILPNVIFRFFSLVTGFNTQICILNNSFQSSYETDVIVIIKTTKIICVANKPLSNTSFRKTLCF